MPRILITGCAGFLAGYLKKRLLGDAGNEVFGITDVPLEDPAYRKIYRGDIRDADMLLTAVAEVKPQLTYHFAAITNVGFSWKNPQLTYAVNIMGSAGLCQALQRFAPGSRLVLMSTAEVYRNRGQAIAEQTEIACANPYAVSKRAMEMIADLYGNTGGLEIIKVRSFNFTGPGQERKFVAADFAAQIAEIEAGLREAVIRVGNLSVVRDFSDVRDVARYLAVLGWRADSGEVLNICSGHSLAIARILELLLAQTKMAIHVEVDKEKFRPADIPMLAGDCSRLRQRFALEPEYALETTLADLLDWWRATINK